MKKLYSAVAISSLLSAVNVANARESLIDLDDASIGGVAGPVIKYSQVLGQDSLEIGFIGGATLTTGKQSILIGAGGFGSTTEFEEDIDFGYAGVVLGYAYAPQNILHIDNRLLLGAGAIHQDNINGTTTDRSGSFLVAELSSQLDISVTQFFEMGIGGSYRVVSAPSRVSVANKDINGAAVFLSLQFGKL